MALDGGNAFSTWDQPDTDGQYFASTKVVNDAVLALKRQFGDESGVQIQDQDVIRWVNDAQVVINERNKILKTASSTITVPGQAEYTFPNERILQIESVTLDSKLLPNVPFAQVQERLTFLDPSGNQHGYVQFWYVWAGKLVLWPTPDNMQTLKLFYTRQADAVQYVTDKIDLPDKYFPQILSYCLQQAYEMDENFQAAQVKGTQFDQDIARMADEERRGQQMTYPVIGLTDDSWGGW
jgi:hypothetical protein